MPHQCTLKWHSPESYFSSITVASPPLPGLGHRARPFLELTRAARPIPTVGGRATAQNLCGVRLSNVHGASEVLHGKPAQIVIRDYAARRGFEIATTCDDRGRQFAIEGRDAFRQLINDVENKKADFKAILVYDVSRWGRFQDADESAYYEYICKRTGITVCYCAEQFENDGSLGTTIIKSMKKP